MITTRRAADRGHADHGWLKTWHTFSFGTYQDPEQMGFRTLRVINEDFVDPAQGFGTHPHRDMEIVTYVLSGAVEHADSMGNGSVIRPGEVQRMTAGTGVTHSEQNPSADEVLHLLQIWILPEAQGLEPGYEQRAFDPEQRRGQLRLVGSRDGREGSVTIHQDVNLYAGLLGPDERLEHALAPDRHGWLQVARGEVSVNGQELRAGDGAAISGESRLELAAAADSEVLLFDLA